MSSESHPEKAPYGSPCNNCGLCCREELCPLAQMVFPRAIAAPCPALEKDGEREVCGFVKSPEQYRPVAVSIHGAEALRSAALYGIGAGIGCDARLEGEGDPPPEFVKALMKAARAPLSARLNVVRLWRH